MTTTHHPSTPATHAAYEARTTGLPARIRHVLNLDDFEQAAARYLPRPLGEYVLGAAEDNRSLAANRAAFRRHEFVTRVLADVSRRSTQTTLLGQSYRVPFGIAPVGISALLAYQGDLAMALAARQEGACMIMSGSSLMRLEEIHERAPGTWFQAYLPGDPVRRAALVERVARAGYETLVVTVDIPVWANRENNIRAGFSLPLRPTPRLAWEGVTHPGWLVRTLLRTLATRGMPHFENSFAERGAPAFSAKAVRDTTGRDHLTWDDIAAIRRQWRGNLVVKGILSVEDARRALAIGAEGIIVSNHGGRQLDGAAAPACAARHRGRGRAAPGRDDGRRHPARRRRADRAVAGRPLRVRRPPVHLRRRRGRPGRRGPCHPASTSRGRSQHGDAGCQPPGRTRSALPVQV